MKKTIGLLLLLAMVCSVASAGTIKFQNGLNGYDGTVDSGAREEAGLEENNYGSFSPLSSNHESDVREMVAFFRFDDMFGSGANQISETGQTITSAKLGLYVTSVQNYGISRLVNAYAMLLPVTMGDGNNEQATTGEVCWSYRAYDGTDWGGGTNAGPVEDLDYTTSDYASQSCSAGGFIVFDVTAIVSKWYAGTLDNEGFLIRGGEDTPGRRVNYYTEENGTMSLRPYLEVTYTPEPATAVLFVVGGIGCLLRRKNG